MCRIYSLRMSLDVNSLRKLRNKIYEKKPFWIARPEKEIFQLITEHYITGHSKL